MAYPLEMWARMKVDYETGNYSARELREKYGKRYKVSENTIEKKIEIEKWQKGIRNANFEKKVKETTEEILTRLGMPKQRRIQLLMEGVEKADKLAFEGKGENMICTPIPDYKVRLDYLAELNKMTGDYSATKTEIKIEELQFEIIPSGDNAKS